MNRNQETKRTKAAWVQVVSGFVESGLTQRMYCQRSGVAVSTLQYWLRRIREEEDSVGERGCEFIEVGTRSARAGYSEGDAGAGTVYELELECAVGVRRLLVRRGFDAGEVAVLVAILEGRRC